MMKVRNVVTYFHQNAVATAHLEKVQEEIRPSERPLKLKIDRVTRWRSTLRMCQRMCELQDALDTTIATHPVDGLTPEEWDALREITVVLKVDFMSS